MKPINSLNFLAVGVVIAMLAIMLTPVTATTPDQTRPNAIYRESSLFFDNRMIKANTSESAVELVLNSATYSGEQLTVRGNPDVIQSPASISVEGNVSAIHTLGRHRVISGIQFDNYLPQFPVDQRFRRVPVSDRETTTRAVSINHTIALGFTYDDLQSNDNFTKLTRENLDATAFVNRRGTIRASTINDTDGTPLAKVFGFSYSIRIVVYQTSTKQLIGAHSETTRGFGNIFPASILSFLSNSSIVQQRSNDLPNITSHQDRISWFSVGYNSTLDLDVYRAQFQMLRERSSILFSPASAGLSLSSVSTGMELFFDSLVVQQSPSLETDDVDAFDTLVVNNALEQDNIVLSSGTIANVSSDQSLDLSSVAIFGAQIIALVIVGNVLYRRFR